MIFINEWLPNPVGNDATGEFVELFNNGSAPVNVGGWTLETNTKKPKKVSGVVPANGYLVLYRKQTKLVIKNSDEAVALYDAAGKLVDQSSFAGTAPEGKSFNRIDQTPISDIGTKIQNFAWGDPTPAAANHVTANNTITATNYTFNAPINQTSLGVSTVAAMMFAAAVCVIALVVYSIKTNEDLSDLFFG